MSSARPYDDTTTVGHFGNGCVLLDDRARRQAVYNPATGAADFIMPTAR